MERAFTREPSYIPHVLVAGALVVAALVGVRVERNIDYSQATGCPAISRDFDPIGWAAAPIANSLDGQGYQDEEILARDNCPR